MWWKKYQEKVPDLVRMTRQYLTVPVTCVSPERFFSRVGLGLVQTDLCGSLLDTTMILDGNPGTRVPVPNPWVLVPGHFFYFIFEKKLLSLCFFSRSLSFFLYTHFGFFPNYSISPM
jgi:hypothetical protein